MSNSDWSVCYIIHDSYHSLSDYIALLTRQNTIPTDHICQLQEHLTFPALKSTT